MNNRWHIDQTTGLPTIHRHPDAHDYLTPEVVKQMVGGQDTELATPGRTLSHYFGVPDSEPGDEDACPVCDLVVDGICPSCHQPIPTGTE